MHSERPIMKKSFIIAYYGKWPSWFHYFLYTCSLNKDFTFIFFTDIIAPENKPDNVIFHSYSFNELIELVSKKMGVAITIEQPYKLCDLKPAYGEIFEDFLHDSAYWGHLDIDVLLGSLNDVLNDETIEGFDIISSRKEMINGSLTLYRNNKFVNTLYKHIPLLVEMINDKKSHYLDEYHFTRTLQMFEKRGEVKILFREFIQEDALNEVRGKRAWALLFSKEKSIDLITKKSIAYFHFIHSKSKNIFKDSFPKELNHTFILTELGYLAYSKKNYYKSILNCYRCNARYYLKHFVKKKLRK